MNEEDVKWIKNNWDNISDEYKEDIMPNKYSDKLEGLKREEHFVILLLDRQKPSVEASYDYDEERIGVNKNGKVVWGFDSGCSCPSPWDDAYPDCYNISKTWKEFIGNAKDFDKKFLEECDKTLNDIKKDVKK